MGRCQLREAGSAARPLPQLSLLWAPATAGGDRRRTRPGSSCQARCGGGGGCSQGASPRSAPGPRSGRRTARPRAARRGRGRRSSRRRGSATASRARCRRSRPGEPTPVAQGVGGHLRPVVTTHEPRRGAAFGDEPVQHVDGLVGVDTAVALDRQRLAGELVHDVQQLEVVPISGLIPLEIDRPHVIGPLRPQPIRRDRGVPSRWRLRRLRGTRSPSSRHTRRVRLLFSSHPSSSSSRWARRYPHRGRSREIPRSARAAPRHLGATLGRGAGWNGAGPRIGTPAAPTARADPEASSTAWRRRDGLTSFPAPSPSAPDIRAAGRPRSASAARSRPPAPSAA